MKEMTLINDLITANSENNHPIKDVMVGVSWTGVHGKYGGVAKDLWPSRCSWKLYSGYG